MAAPASRAPRSLQISHNDGRLHLAALTGLRALLALWVIVHHLCGPGQWLAGWVAAMPDPAARLFRGGYLAVSIFFILSGFVLALSYARAEWNADGLRKYAIARVARVYPVYALSLLVVAPFIAREPMAAAAKPWAIGNYVLVLQGWTGSLGVGWNTPAWSLSCEMFFYLVFPLAAVALRRAGWRGLAAAAAIALAVPELLPRVGVPGEWKPIVHLSDFVMGIVAARVWWNVRTRWDGLGPRLYVPAALAMVALIAWPWVLRDVVELNTPLRPLSALLLMGLALGGGAAARWFSTATMVFLGKASYAMYILHVPLLWWWGRWSHKLPAMSGPLSAAWFVAVVIAVSSLVYRYFEEPVNRALRRSRAGAA